VSIPVVIMVVLFGELKAVRVFVELPGGKVALGEFTEETGPDVPAGPTFSQPLAEPDSRVSWLRRKYSKFEIGKLV